jgi:hypothetical protein
VEDLSFLHLFSWSFVHRMSFPTPVGGTPFPEVFAPCIVFAVIYALTIPLMLFWVYDKHSRTPLFIGSIIFGIERCGSFVFLLPLLKKKSVVLFVTQSRHILHPCNPIAQRVNETLKRPSQVHANQFRSRIANDPVNILCVYLVNPTHGSEKYDECPAWPIASRVRSRVRRALTGDWCLVSRFHGPGLA